MKSKQRADSLELRGVRVHNLKGINLSLPHGKIIVITGVSGSGKSSLAFDTIYAEGYRRYAETLSSYVRQFLERLERPEAELIEGIAPSVAITQMQGPKNPRSTVATVTGIYDLLRLLFAKAGVQKCYRCKREIREASPGYIWSVLEEYQGEKAIVAFEPLLGKRELRRMGFTRILREGEILYWEEAGNLKEGDLALADRFVVDKGARERIDEAFHVAFKYGDGRAYLFVRGNEIRFTTKRECPYCRIDYPELEPGLFSFNSPKGACPVCSGMGEEAVLDWDKIIPDPNISLEQGAVVPFNTETNYDYWMEMLEEAGIRTDVPYKDLTLEEREWVEDAVNEFFGWLEKKKYKVQARVTIARYRKYVPCRACGGKRLNPTALNVYYRGRNIGEITEMSAKEALKFFASVNPGGEAEERLISELKEKLEFLVKVGLGYITLDRMSFTLSGGEWERVSLASALASSITGVIYVLDEPSIGLHPRDVEKLIDTIRRLRGIGNTIVVVEHDPQIILSSDWAVELGPGAGEKGGKVLYSGTIEGLKKSKTPTGNFLRGEVKLPSLKKRESDGWVVVRGARKFNLKNIEARFKWGVLNCITGVSGSGKSTLLFEVLYKGITGEAKRGESFDEILLPEQFREAIVVSQHSIPRSSRATPATFMKAFDPIRKVFASLPKAKRLGFSPGHFSFNSPLGRCPVCKGAGWVKVEMYFMEDVEVKCDFCGGKRFREEVLKVRYNGKTISDVLNMTVSEALELFRDHGDVLRELYPLVELGLDYLKLGQPLSTLSVGEAQRLKLAQAFKGGKGGTLFLMDEPTTGLHPVDIRKLLLAMERLMDGGNTFIVIEHNMDFVSRCQWVVDLGPEGGDLGGNVVAEGSPMEIAKAETYTGRALKSLIHSEVPSAS